MAELKYKKYIVTELKIPESEQKAAAKRADWQTRVLLLNDKMIEGAFHMGCGWYLKTPEAESTVAHTHDSDEIIGFFGSNPQNPHDLGGEIELWLEDEKYILTKSCLIFVPKGMKHCPLIVRRVDRPIFHFTTLTGGKYTREDATSA